VRLAGAKVVETLPLRHPARRGSGEAGQKRCEQRGLATPGLTGRSSAKSIITHHTDLVNLDPDAAAAVEAHMDGDQAAAVDNLTISICNQGPAYEHDPAYLDGWCVLVRMYNDDGSPLLDSNGEQIFDYQFSDQTSIDMQPAIAAVLASVKNDPTLEGVQYQVIYHGDPVDEDALPPATPTVLNSDDAASVARRLRNTSAGESLTLSTTGYHHNVLFYDATHSATNRSFSLKILNLNFIWYGLYLEYLDADGVPLASSERSSVLNDLLASGLDLETDTLKFWDVVSSPATVFGAPIPFPYQISLSLPEGASQVRLSLIGPGAYGKLDYGPSIVIGAVMTAIVCFGVPMYFLSKAVGTTETASLEDLFQQKGIILKTLLLYSQLYSEATGTETNDLGIEGSVTSILASLTQDLFMNLKSTIPELWEWLTGQVAEAEAEASVPFVGWVIRILAIAGTTADLATSEAEIGTNPYVISNTVSFTNSVTVVVSHDPEDFEFPLDATHFQVQITAGDKALERKLGPLSPRHRSHRGLQQGTGAQGGWHLDPLPQVRGAGDSQHAVHRRRLRQQRQGDVGPGRGQRLAAAAPLGPDHRRRRRHPDSAGRSQPQHQGVRLRRQAVEVFLQRHIERAAPRRGKRRGHLARHQHRSDQLAVRAVLHRVRHAALRLPPRRVRRGRRPADRPQHRHRGRPHRRRQVPRALLAQLRNGEGQPDHRALR
jgi:hypothetical protein